MRPIKFRQPIWRDNKFYKFHYWGFVKNAFISPSYCPKKSQKESKQFTGLLDKNEKEIYEGDIIKITNCCSSYSLKGITSKFDNKPIGKINWNNGFFIKNWEHFNLKEVDFFGYEVIGNVCENLELLEGNHATKK